MGAELHSEFAGALGGVRHRGVVADMAAAGHVGGCDQRPDLVFAGRAFAEVGADVDHTSAPFVSGRSQIRNPPRAKNRASNARTTAKPSLGTSAPMMNGANAETPRPAL